MDDLAYVNGALAKGKGQAPSTGNSQGSAPSAADDSSVTSASIANHSITQPDPESAPSAPSLAELQPLIQALRLSTTEQQALALSGELGEKDLYAEAGNLSEEGITDLLSKLDMANLVTDGLEERLDELLGELDGMLEGLQSVTAGENDEDNDKPDALASVDDGASKGDIGTEQPSSDSIRTPAP